MTPKLIDRLKTAWLYTTATVEYALLFVREAMQPTSPSVGQVRALEDEALEADAAYLAAHGVRNSARTARAFHRLQRMNAPERAILSAKITTERERLDAEDKAAREAWYNEMHRRNDEAMAINEKAWATYRAGGSVGLAPTWICPDDPPSPKLHHSEGAYFPRTVSSLRNTTADDGDTNG
jgi:hypothetical protein